MSKEKGTYVVGLAGASMDIDKLTDEISGIKGVHEVEFYYLTRKLTLELINKKLSGVLRPKA
jgi:hypothetical protein